MSRRPHSGAWTEFDGDGPGLVMVHPGWTNDVETLAFAIREAGWFGTTGEAREAAETAEFAWGWVGTDEELSLRICRMDGYSVEIGDFVTDVSHVTLARIPARGRDCPR